MNKLIINKIQKSEINEVANILTDAFKTNPAYSTIFRDKDHLEEGLLWLFKANLCILNQKEILTNVVKDKNSGKIIGTFTIIPPQGVKKDLSIYSKIRLPYFISKFGIKTLFRMLSLDSYNKKLLTEAMKTSEYYYLHMMVIKEEYRGTGVGSMVLKSTIQELINSKPKCRSLGLTTQLPENVVFYSRLGFNKLDMGYIDFKGDSYFNCNMMLKLR